MSRPDHGSDNNCAHWPNERPAQLVVFSDDWGRHPSSCQHLIRQLLPRYQTLWVNTIGTRLPRLCREDLAKITQRLRQWWRPLAAGSAVPDNLQVVSPPMFPGFRRMWQRRFNAATISRTVNAALGPRQANQKRVAITTIPITADLPQRVDVDRWIYYCVDDFSVWPGLDSSVMDAMERRLVAEADAVVAVSRTLQDRLAAMGSASTLLTHGIDLHHWQAVDNGTPLPQWWASVRPPIILFWGVVDRRLDYHWCAALASSFGSLVLVGPQQSPDPRLARLPRLHMPGPAPYATLPRLAAAADVLVMPYADLPVTRAIQPLKFKEYLATGKPVVVRDLPATKQWADAADVVGDVDQLPQIVARRIDSGLPADQQFARHRLARESWPVKADLFDQILRAA